MVCTRATDTSKGTMTGERRGYKDQGALPGETLGHSHSESASLCMSQPTCGLWAGSGFPRASPKTPPKSEGFLFDEGGPRQIIRHLLRTPERPASVSARCILCPWACRVLNEALARNLTIRPTSKYHGAGRMQPGQH